VGGGGIRTMQRYWERTTATLERTGSEIRQKADPGAGRQAVTSTVDEERARMQAAQGGPQREIDLREETAPPIPPAPQIPPKGP
jgi:hypothetical protein